MNTEQQIDSLVRVVAALRAMKVFRAGCNVYTVHSGANCLMGSVTILARVECYPCVATVTEKGIFIESRNSW